MSTPRPSTRAPRRRLRPKLPKRTGFVRVLRAGGGVAPTLSSAPRRPSAGSHGGHSRTDGQLVCVDRDNESPRVLVYSASGAGTSSALRSLTAPLLHNSGHVRALDFKRISRSGARVLSTVTYGRDIDDISGPAGRRGEDVLARERVRGAPLRRARGPHPMVAIFLLVAPVLTRTGRCSGDQGSSQGSFRARLYGGVDGRSTECANPGRTGNCGVGAHREVAACSCSGVCCTAAPCGW